MTLFGSRVTVRVTLDVYAELHETARGRQWPQGTVDMTGMTRGQ
jgi:hypothetical protein